MSYYRGLVFIIPIFISMGCHQGAGTQTTDTVNVKHNIVITVPTENSTGSVSGNISGCGYNKMATPTSLTLYYPTQRAINQISAILKYTGLSANFKIYQADIENAVAVIIDNKRYILYDDKLLSMADERSGNYWSSMSILAHEIGHHLSGHTIENGGSNPGDELEADKFSGFVLYKMGASLQEAKMAIETFGTPFETATHPAKERRLQAIERGWEEANETRFNGAVPPPPKDITDFSGGMSEFNTENLLDEPSYDELRQKNGYGSWVSEKMEGIITDKEKDGNAYQIIITKGAESDDPEARKVGEKVWIELYNPWDARQFAGRAQLSWLEEIMVPGRRIAFAYGEAGTQPSRYFAYIRYLPANR